MHLHCMSLIVVCVLPTSLNTFCKPLTSLRIQIQSATFEMVWLVYDTDKYCLDFEATSAAMVSHISTSSRIMKDAVYRQWC